MLCNPEIDLFHFLTVTLFCQLLLFGPVLFWRVSCWWTKFQTPLHNCLIRWKKGKRIPVIQDSSLIGLLLPVLLKNWGFNTRLNSLVKYSTRSGKIKMILMHIIRIILVRLYMMGEIYWKNVHKNMYSGFSELIASSNCQDG